MLKICCNVIVTIGLIALAGSSAAVEWKPSVIERELHKVRFAATTGSTVGAPLSIATTEESRSSTIERKSPFKAFVLSAALPGAGQWYTGSRIKSLAFLGVEVATWGLYFKWNGDGDDATDYYRQVNLDHWSRYDYEQRYLLAAYGVTNDNDAAGYTEVSHHLPDELTQQYFEMTGKYDQFAWGWSDATRDGQGLDYWETRLDTELRITGEASTPYSALRLDYENLRDDANQKYDRARKMVIVSIINRLVAGFEAYMSAKKHNESAASSDDAFAGLQVRTSLKSVYTGQDTPFVALSYKF